MDNLIKEKTSDFIGDCIYWGIDPTADSLHVGHLVSLKFLEQFKGRVIILMGVKTAQIGDPSGKSGKRNLPSLEDVQVNVRALKNQITKFLPNASVVSNEHTPEPSFDLISANKLMSLSTVKSGEHTTVQELLYPCYQAADFVHLAQIESCFMQLGGSDQWGNIVTGLDYGQKHGIKLCGVTTHLLTNNKGQKIGKTENGTVWLGGKTTDKQFYDFWRQTPDDKVDEYLAMFVEGPIPTDPRDKQILLAESMMRWKL
jgi:tyrosyl-tRNA synthetase